jgi:hypothetical protein
VVEHSVDQPGDGPNPHRVPRPPVPVHMRHRPEPAQPPDPVHDDPTAAERAVVLHVLGRTSLPARLATRACARRADIPDARVTQVADPPTPAGSRLISRDRFSNLMSAHRPGTESDTSTIRPECSSTAT